MKSLLVCSNSTKDLEIVEKCDEKRIVSSAPDISILDEMGTYDNVVAIGGGAVIDTAKILLSDLSNNLQIFWFLISDNKRRDNSFLNFKISFTLI